MSRMHNVAALLWLKFMINVMLFPMIEAYYYYILLYIITFMKGIENYTPEANHMSRMHNVAALLWLQFMINVMLFPMIEAYYYYYYYYYCTHLACSKSITSGGVFPETKPHTLIRGRCD
jgi:hypothetical protein